MECTPGSCQGPELLGIIDAPREGGIGCWLSLGKRSQHTVKLPELQTVVRWLPPQAVVSPRKLPCLSWHQIQAREMLRPGKFYAGMPLLPGPLWLHCLMRGVALGVSPVPAMAIQLWGFFSAAAVVLFPFKRSAWGLRSNRLLLSQGGFVWWVCSV